MVEDVLRISLSYPHAINHYFEIKYKGNDNEEKPMKAFSRKEDLQNPPWINIKNTNTNKYIFQNYYIEHYIAQNNVSQQF